MNCWCDFHQESRSQSFGCVLTLVPGDSIRQIESERRCPLSIQAPADVSQPDRLFLATSTFKMILPSDVTAATCRLRRHSCIAQWAFAAAASESVPTRFMHFERV